MTLLNLEGLMMRKLFFIPLLIAATHVPELAGSSSLVISRYTAAAEIGRHLQERFHRDFNRGTANVDVSGWSIQDASSAGISWRVTNLSGTIAPGQYYLIQESAGAGSKASLPDPDATGTINMSATSGKVVLTKTQTAFTTICPAGVDVVGFGTAAGCRETSPTSNSPTRRPRCARGAADTNSNPADFAVGAPAPCNSASACSFAAPYGWRTRIRKIWKELPSDRISISILNSPEPEPSPSSR